MANKDAVGHWDKKRCKPRGTARREKPPVPDIFSLESLTQLRARHMTVLAHHGRGMPLSAMFNYGQV